MFVEVNLTQTLTFLLYVESKQKTKKTRKGDFRMRRGSVRGGEEQ